MQNLFNLVVEAAPNAMILVNESGRIVYVNAQSEKLFGYSREELLDKAVEMLVPERFRAAHPALRAQFTAAPEARPMGAGRDLYGRCKDGSEIPIEIALNPLVTEEGSFVLAAIVNIAERKRTEELRLLNAGMRQHSEKLEALNQELEAASRFKSQFVATMSHELRTPLNAIIGMAELLAKTKLDERQGVHVQTINESAEALLAIINSILDFSKIEAGKMDLQSNALNVESVIEGAADVLALQARDKGVMLHTYVDPAIPPMRGDADRLRQILLNLIGNAVKFTERGRVVVRASPIGGTAARDVMLRFEVQDTGIGIPADVLPHLFQPFVQGDGSPSRRFGGTGLGLSISKRLAELMGGEIGVHSEPGSGSLFWFTARFDHPAHPVAQSRTLEGAGGLIVTADDVFAQIVERYLASWGMQSQRAEDPAKVLETLRSDGRATWVAIVDVDATGSPKVAGVVDALRRTMPHRLITVGGAGGLMKPLRQSLLFDSIVRAVDVRRLDAGVPAAVPPPVERTQSDGEILVAEDNERLQRLLKLQFDDLNQSVRFVTDGLEAVRALERERFIMVFMDCQMPNMDGLAATRTIRANEREAGGRVPIVAMTANAFVEDREACIAAGMDDYLAKPVKLADLRNMIERWSRRSVRGS
ncbi:MAG TPA: ATP-binding protein [Candidatus Acidoferrales bacterium]|nr:ATP-binding protein [Candidatus Acidoferrales bacterium]